MSFTVKNFAVAALLTATLAHAQGSSGSGKTTRYWDCCKPSCAWPSDSVTSPVKVCDAKDQPLSDVNAQSGCQGGPAYMCSDQTPWAISSDLAYGFAAVSGASPKCCACYELTFTSTALAGKKMIVQATNTGGDVGASQFDLAIPGGGFGLFDACTTEWGATTDVWGAQYGGSSTNTCPRFPQALQAGCGFRWDWMQGASNPDVDYKEVSCPAELVAKSGCSAAGSSPAPAANANPQQAAVQPANPANPSSSSSASAANSQSTGPTVKHPHARPETGNAQAAAANNEQDDCEL